MKKNIILIGGGGHCKSVIDVIEQEGKFTIAGIIDMRYKIGQEVLGYKVIGCDDDLEALFKKYHYALIAIGHIRNNDIRMKYFNKLKQIGYKLPVIISPLAYVSRHTFIDEGTIVMHQSLVNANSKIGKNCIINTKSLIEHDCIVEDFCHISTGAILNGRVVVRKNNFVGSNATTKEAVTIDCFVKAGSLRK